MSSQLVWKIVSKDSSFLHKQKSNGTKVELTSEPFNITAQNNYRSSGLAQPKGAKLSFGKSAAKGDKTYPELKVVLTKKVASKANKPAKAAVKVTLKPGKKAAQKAVEKLVGTNLYRADLKRAALSALTNARGVAKASKHNFKAAAPLGRRGNALGKRNRLH